MPVIAIKVPAREIRWYRGFFALSLLAQGVFASSEVVKLNCPYCNGEMEKGFLQGGKVLAWVKKKHYLSMTPKAGEVVLDKNHWTGAAVPSWICRQCQKVIIEYAQN